MLDTKKIIDMIKPYNPEKMILFGSFVKKTSTPFSDIDVLIIKKTRKKPSQRIKDVLKLVWGSQPHIEPHVMTPQELDSAIANNRFFITQEVLKNGQVIYER